MSKTVLFQAIQFCISTQFSSIWPIYRTLVRCYYSEPEWTYEWFQWRGTLHSPKLQHYWNLTIRLFHVISRIPVGEGLTPLQRYSWCILQPQPTGQLSKSQQPDERWVDKIHHLIYWYAWAKNSSFQDLWRSLDSFGYLSSGRSWPDNVAHARWK